MLYPSNNLWDANSLPSLTPLNDYNSQDTVDFLALLSKQLNPSALPPAAVSTQSAILGASPPSTEESSSPSPPVDKNKGLNNSNGKKEDGHKRKVQDVVSDDEDDEELDGQPQLKNQKEQPGKKGARRKSTGDDRALKRKEQNRAAQRAFRERKEKHVKDLEDQVAALEAKSKDQSSENESLRELLGRLQNENLMLKQSAFTFNFPSASTPAAAPGSAATTSRPTPSASASPAEAGPSPKDSPMGGAGTGYTPLLSFSNLPEAISNANSNNSPPPLVFFSPPTTQSNPTPYTTIASNPMYTSYTDFSGWDQFFADTALDQTLAGVTMPNSTPNNSSSSNLPAQSAVPLPPSLSPPGSGTMEDLFSSTGNFGDLIPFSGFSPSPAASANSPVDHRMTGVTSTAPTGAFSLSSRERPEPPKRTSSPCGGADADEAPLPGSTSYQSVFAAGMNAGPSSVPEPHDGTKCPRSAEEMAEIIKNQPVATLGSVPGMDEKKAGAIKEMWEKMKQDSRWDFTEADEEALCQEWKSKVKCSEYSTDKPCEELAEAMMKIRANREAMKAVTSSPFSYQSLLGSNSSQNLPQATHRDSASSLASSVGLPTPISPMASLAGSDAWMNDMIMNPGSAAGDSEFMSFLGGGGGFSPGAYLNLPEKE